jgi:formylglycine-generating enzyme required for sulfatase activity
MKLKHSLKPRVYFLSLFLALALSPFAYSQVDVVIQSFDSSGQLRFNEVPNAEHYRIEWAPSANGPWTNFAAATLSLDHIAATGSGIVTSMVPMLYRVVATVTNPPLAPAGMSLIPSGTFVMGDTFGGEGWPSAELPVHTNYISAFYMDQYLVTKALWDQVKAFNGGNGYSYSNPGQGKMTNHPVHSVNWYDVVKWCNARSEMEGLTPVYYTDIEFSALYKTGEIAPFANWAASGYRLPTEAEWEKAARGGLEGKRFPWGDTITRSNANYFSGGSYEYDLEVSNGGYHPVFDDGIEPYTSPVGYFAPNAYGLYDMAGNVWEWCWDWFGESYYQISPFNNPTGPIESIWNDKARRSARGGSWYWDFGAVLNRNAWRGQWEPYHKGNNLGFRCARGL